MSQKAECPVCGAEIVRAPDTIKSELLSCKDCGSELEVVSLDPFTLAEAPQQEEDWGQ